NILVSGITMPSALKAQQLLADEWNVGANIYSVTSWGELARDGVEYEKAALREPAAGHPQPFATEVLCDDEGPFVAATDYMRGVPELI
ncbi:transketolase-like TK C-terminal-containing protein, partial [Leifsonia sp. SIMBA_070]|uniref:transketolase-like TK C-terminal-containing protein n=1 Tax=Leifsonia sp. SIMBA_070 TaxID=3085810 RepID=UPI00397A37B2